VLEPVGTAPGLVVPVAEGRSGPPVVVLPGPPAELQGMWPAALADAGCTVAVGESCTGGLLTARLTAAPGSSAVVLGGVTAYANSAKEQFLGVPAAVLAATGAVSPEVALALAEGARERFGADIGVGVTGIAGPGGGTADKPVGTVHLATVGPEATATRSAVLGGSREAIRQRTTTLALHLLRQLVLGGPPA
jgi:nicotinamide-nucleotide amidase